MNQIRQDQKAFQLFRVDPEVSRQLQGCHFCLTASHRTAAGGISKDSCARTLLMNLLRDLNDLFDKQTCFICLNLHTRHAADV